MISRLGDLCLALACSVPLAAGQELPRLPGHVVAAAEGARVELRLELGGGQALVGRLGLEPLERRVRVDWTPVELAEEGRSRRGRGVTESEPARSRAWTCGVRFEPTAVARLGHATVALAGRDRWGNAVLERWTFARGADGGALPADSAGALPGLARVDELFSGNQPGESIVRGLWGVPFADANDAPAASLLLFFHGTRSVYRFDTASEEFGLLAMLDGDGAEGVLEIPALAENWSRTGSVLELPDGTVLYRFGREPRAAEDGDRVAAEPERDRLYLIDLDGDGWIDASRHWNRDDPRHLGYVAEAVLRD